jgi:hypothetical protein
VNKWFAIVAGQRRQVIQFIGGKPKFAEIVDHLSQTRSHGIAARKRRPAKEQMKHRFLVSPSQHPIALGHGELVEVGEQSQRCAINGCQRAHDGLLS